ncbi:MAG: DUF4932 domain-containing protein [Bacillota bacterium]|nr:DUF4932 domain-containing protein [Bacillota bacterium]
MEGIKTVVDPRVELLSIIQLFSDYGKKHRPLTEFNSSYVQRIKDYFSPFQEHKAISIYSQLISTGFNFSHPMDFILDVEFDLESNSLSLIKSVGESTVKSAGGLHQLELLTHFLTDFANQTIFSHFFTTNESFYKAIVEEVKEDLLGMNITKAFEEYYGVQYQRFYLVLNPLCDPGGYGIWKQCINGKLAAYSITGPVREEDGLLYFVNEPEGLCIFNWHEFGHSMVNPLTTRYLQEINVFEKLFAPSEKQMKSQAYGSWEICLNEHIVRAVVIRLITRELGEKRAQELLEYEKSIGFYLLEPLIEWLKTYEKNRSIYMNFAEYYPSILSLLVKL